MSLITSSNTWLVLAVMVGTVVLGIWLERKFKWAAKISSLVIILLISVLLSNIHIMPTQSRVYDMVWDYLLPMALPLLLFKSDLRKICKESGKMLIAFLLGAAGSVVGAFVSYFIFRDKLPELQGLAAMMAGTYVGGSVNFAILAKSFNVSGKTVSAATIADNLNMAIYILVLLAIPTKVASLSKEEAAAEKRTGDQNSVPAGANTEEKRIPLNVKSFSIGMAIAVAAIVASDFIANGFARVLTSQNVVLATIKSFAGNRYMWITTISVAISTIFAEKVKCLYGMQDVGMFFILCFMFVIGAPASVPEIIHKSPLMLLFAMIIVACNMLFTFVGGSICKLDRRTMILASNANIGGPTTAASFAIAKGWEELLGPSILVGCLGYAIGNYLGLLVGNAL